MDSFGEAQAEAFMEAYPNVTVDVVNAGTNEEQYTKLQNAIKAGSGAPDVAQIEYYAVPQFALTDSLLDLSQYGFGELEDQYTAWPVGRGNRWGFRLWPSARFGPDGALLQ